MLYSDIKGSEWVEAENSRGCPVSRQQTLPEPHGCVLYKTDNYHLEEDIQVHINGKEQLPRVF